MLTRGLPPFPEQANMVVVYCDNYYYNTDAFVSGQLENGHIHWVCYK